ncbi:peptide ABC transporter substrate-binding protein [Paenibacillus sp. SEL3]|uniref:Peptide ABC transporter substrate-binding protein n=1 Tax=Paenibacillus polymyxa TaxID=1406 RepID=A0A8I1IXN5_PAEPO|nr:MULTISPECIES: peptide ABC transporter substrate-binding protein [Paenibacillus]KAF6572347.1 peptide ABC transporter substrate-binding protein [Paenibacillus sp. EKM206P]KAF6586758.1 peptide ABC transporter substrate-binding protein [Paenibacillus sp. EKM205P]MBM0634998.1 peptide ABC transporter substrate-binding protein [Paenibacillus polymyxa]MBO3286409.1 peptide ABC transporter substrate-binding protein [Paenibacillus polymyxa]MBP1309853.1 oligopeptide transport system substrate-binding p
MKRKSFLVLLTLILAVGALLAGCGSSKNDTNGKGAQENTSTTPAPADKQILRINLASEPPTFDPAQAQDTQANTVLKTMYEGLVRMGPDGKEIPGVAESWKISDDGKTYTFKLRDTAKWSNGDPVKASDFVFAWQRVLDPSTAPAPPYAYQLYYIKNAEGYNLSTSKSFKGTKVTDFKDVGVKAVDDHTLQVELEHATPYFLGLTSFYTYYPVHPSVKGNDKWATKKESMITNGPFTLSTWETGQKIEVSKSENYWGKDEIKLKKITMSLVNSGATELASYRSGQLDYAGKPNGEIPADQMMAVKNEMPNEFQAKGIASTYYYLFNVTEKPFNNLKIRKAFAMSIQRQPIVDRVTMGGEIPAYGFVPPGIKGLSQEYRNEHKDDYFKEDVAEAKKLLQEGMKEEGVTSLPPITLLYNSTEGHQKIALAVADMWKKSLGIDVKTQNQEWGVFIQTRNKLNFQIARGGWSADFNDPMTFLDIWTTGNGNNNSGYSNPEYDGLIKAAKTETDPGKRMEIFAKAEKLLVQDDMVLLPIYYYSNTSLTKPNVKGVALDFSGAIDFTRAYITQ